MSGDSHADSFEQAWIYASGSAKLDRYRRRGLIALAQQDSALTETAARLTGADRALLDLHVDDPRSLDQEAVASTVGAFVVRVAKSVKEITKSNLGRERWRDELRIFAPSPGSVRLVFVEPPARQTVGGLEKVGHVPAPEAQAMRQLVVLLALAETDAETLDAAVFRLRGPARRAVRLMSETVASSSWTLSGALKVPGRESLTIALSAAGATRLAEAARETEDERVSLSTSGTVDGWTWSTSTMRFVPEAGRPFDVVVPQELEGLAAQCNAAHGRVQAWFSGVRVHPTGDTGFAKTSYWLERMEPEADLFEGHQ